MNKAEVFTRHDCALKEYINDVNQKYSAFLEKQRAPYVSVLEAARRYFIFMNYVIDQVDATAGPMPPLLVYARIAEKLAGLEACLHNGFIESASGILRGIFEAVFTLSLLTESDMEERSRLYSQYEHVGRWYNMKDQEELVREGEISQQEFEKRFPPSEIASITTAYDAVKADYHPKSPGTFGWAWKLFATGPKDRNPSLKDIAKRLKRLGQYNTLYSVLSTVAHVGSIGRKALTSEDGKIIPGFHFNDRTKCFICMAILYAHEALTRIRTYLPPPLAEELSFYSNCLLQELLHTNSKITRQS